MAIDKGGLVKGAGHGADKALQDPDRDRQVEQAMHQRNAKGRVHKSQF
jgi:hypothetical protein